MTALLLFALAFAAPVKVIQGTSTRIQSLDPFSPMGIEAYSALGNALEPLARKTPKGLEPVLATSWDVSNRRLRIKLRKSVHFHNGEKFTAEDVKATFDRPKSAIWQSMWSKVDKVRVLDWWTVEFMFKELDYELFVNLMTTLRVLPKSYNGQLVGTGPFELLRFDAGRSVEFKPFEKWWNDPKPKFNLLIKTVPDAEAAVQALAKGELDFYEIPASSSVNGTDLPVTMGTGLWINLNLTKFPDAQVRKALVMLWDRESLNQKVFGGRWQVAADIYGTQTTPIPFDRAKATEILKDKKLEFTLLVHSAEEERWATLYQADALKAGVKVSLKRIDEDGQWLALLKDGKFDAFTSGGPALDEVYSAVMHSKGEFNFYRYRNPKVDKLLEQLNQTFDPGKRAPILSSLKEILRAETPNLPGLISRRQKFLISPRLEVDRQLPLATQKWRLKN